MGKGAGGGGLRILRHKTWHVWKFENLQKVEKDEARNAEQETLRKSKEDKETAIVRLRKLREKARNRQGHEIDQQLAQLEQDNTDEQHPRLRYSDQTIREALNDQKEALSVLPLLSRPDEPLPSDSSKADGEGSGSGGAVERRHDEKDGGGQQTWKNLDKSLAREARGLLKEKANGDVNYFVPDQHINLFADAEKQSSKLTTNSEAEAEKAKKDKAQLKKIMPEIFFGESAVDPNTGMAPWYAISDKDQHKAARRLKKTQQEKEKRSLNYGPLMKGLRMDEKRMNDPLNQINAALHPIPQFPPSSGDPSSTSTSSSSASSSLPLPPSPSPASADHKHKNKKRKKGDDSSSSSSSSDNSNSSSDSDSDSGSERKPSKKKKEKKKEKKKSSKHSKKSKKKKKDKKDKKDDSKSDVAKLRAERLQREKQEQERAKRLLALPRPGSH